jgi:hypothetical protein
MGAAERIVVPVGQYGGAVTRETTGTTGYAIRRGRMVFTMSWQQATLWMEAHGRTAELGRTAWTRSTIIDRRTDDATPADAETWFGDLVALGLLAEIDPDGPEAVSFAHTYRLLPAAGGKGNTPEDPFRFRAGHLPYRTVNLSWNEVRLWREGYQQPTLWDACMARAAAEERVGYRLDPHRLLTETLKSLHHMLALRLTYVDRARHEDGGSDL